MKKGKFVYMAVSCDDFSYILCVSDRCKDLSNWSGRSLDSIYTAISRGTYDSRNKCRYIKIRDINNECPYQQRGFADRNDYFNYLSKKNNVSIITIQVFSKMLGIDKDFSSLVEMIESLSKKKYKRRKL